MVPLSFEGIAWICTPSARASMWRIKTNDHVQSPRSFSWLCDRLWCVVGWRFLGADASWAAMGEEVGKEDLVETVSC
eukprot:885161-Amphidinium_carterae.1